MAFIRMEDMTGDVEIILFPNSYQQTLGLWERDRIVLVRGKVSSRDREGKIGTDVKIMVDDAREITTQQAVAYQATGKKRKTPKVTAKAKLAVAAAKKVSIRTDTIDKPLRLFIRLANTEDEQTLFTLKETIDSHKGETEVVLVLGEAEQRQAIKLPGGIDRHGGGLAKLQTLIGSENLVLQ